MTAGSTLALVNPAAGGGRCARRAADALSRLRDAGIDVVARETRGPGTATEMARAARGEGFDTVVAVGGDGTVNEVLNGLVDGEGHVRPRLGILPLGTGNSFLRDFGTGDLEYAVGALVASRARPCDVVRLEHDVGARLFLNVLGFGFPAEVGALVERRLKPFGASGYILGVLWRLAQLRTLTLPYGLDGDGIDPRPTTFLCVCNSRYTGGTMEMAPSAEIDDGEIDVLRVDLVGRLELLRTFPKIFSGRHIEHPAVTLGRARRMDFATDEAVDVNLDGEVLSVVPRTVEVLRQAIDVMA